MIERLNERLGGRLLRTADNVVTVRERRLSTRPGQEMRVVDRRLDLAKIAAAQQIGMRPQSARKKKKRK